MRLLENSVGEYADRLVSIERAYQLGIAHNIARIYADILNEPLPAEIARLVAHLDPGQEASAPARKVRDISEPLRSPQILPALTRAWCGDPS